MKPGSNDGGSWTFSLARTTVRVRPAVLLNLTGLWAALAWLTGRRRPEWGRGIRWLAGLLDTAALASADFGHGLILGGSLMPLPIVDGGTLLKWALVECGSPEAEAEAAVRKAALAVATGASTACIVAARRRRWFHSLGFFALALLLLGGGVGKVE